MRKLYLVAAALMTMKNSLMVADTHCDNDLANDKERSKNLSLAQMAKVKNMSPKEKKRYLKEIGKA